MDLPRIDKSKTTLLATLVIISLLILSGCSSINIARDGGSQETVANAPDQDLVSTTTTIENSDSNISLNKSRSSTYTETKATPTPAVTSSETSTERDQYGTFLRKLPVLMNETARIPMRIRGVAIQNNTLFLIHNATSADQNRSKKFTEWSDIAASYAGAVRDTNEFYDNAEVPARMVVYETNSSDLLTDLPSKFEVTTKNATSWTDDKITSEEFTRRWQDTIESQEQQEIEFTRAVDRSAKNITYYPNKSVEIED